MVLDGSGCIILLGETTLTTQCCNHDSEEQEDRELSPGYQAECTEGGKFWRGWVRCARKGMGTWDSKVMARAVMAPGYEHALHWATILLISSSQQP